VPFVQGGLADSDISVIMVNHNHGDQAQRAVESLYALPDEVSFRLVVVDNASSDNVSRWLCTHFPQACVLQNKLPKGFAHNVNLGLRIGAEADYVLLMNPDIECLPGLLKHLVAFLESHTDVGIAGPQLLNPDLTVQPSCRAFSTPLSILVRGLHLDSALSNMEFMQQYLMTEFDHASVADTDWITGALMIVRREAVRQVGLMDERYFLYSEDQDWCCRMWQAGWRVCYVPQAQAIHAHRREGMRRPWSRAAWYQIASASKMFLKFGWHLSRVK
jgi:N-acetylglucosaminyl-diphospho-decaprenol L-rhamnosyltransferase